MSVEYASPAWQTVKSRQGSVSEWVAQRREALRGQEGRTGIKTMAALGLLGSLTIAYGLTQHGSSMPEIEQHVPDAKVTSPATPAATSTPAALARQKLTVEQVRGLKATAGTEVKVVGTRGRDIGTRVIGRVGNLLVVEVFDNTNCGFRPEGQRFIEAEVPPGSFGSKVGDRGEWEDIALDEGSDGKWHVQSADAHLNDPNWPGTSCLDHNPS